MPLLSGIYDTGPLAPIARIDDNLRIYTRKLWEFFRIKYIEPWPRGRQNEVEVVALAGAANIGANANLAKRIIPILQVLENELLQLRWYPIDDVEGILWEQGGTLRFNQNTTVARVNLFTKEADPNLSTTQFWVLGFQRDMNLEVWNPNPVALPQARFAFYGYRYVLEPLKTPPVNFTSLPAEGM